MSITMEDFKLALPPKLQKQATDDNLQLLNDILNEQNLIALIYSSREYLPSVRIWLYESKLLR